MFNMRSLEKPSRGRDQAAHPVGAGPRRVSQSQALERVTTSTPTARGSGTTITPDPANPGFKPITQHLVGSPVRAREAKLRTMPSATQRSLPERRVQRWWRCQLVEDPPRI